jgi:hypothetical protein
VTFKSDAAVSHALDPLCERVQLDQEQVFEGDFLLGAGRKNALVLLRDDGVHDGLKLRKVSTVKSMRKYVKGQEGMRLP